MLAWQGDKIMSFVGVLSKNPSKYFFPINVLTPKAYTVSTNGNSIDRYRNGGYAALTLLIDPGLWTDGTHAFTIQESSDNTTWTTVAAADLLSGPGVPAGQGAFTTISSVGTAVFQEIDYIGRLRYVRVISTEAGTTTGAVYAVLGLLFAPAVYPAA